MAIISFDEQEMNQLSDELSSLSSNISPYTGFPIDTQTSLQTDFIDEVYDFSCDMNEKYFAGDNNVYTQVLDAVASFNNIIAAHTNLDSEESTQL